MLKLKKIINSKTSAPELVTIEIPCDYIYAAGAVYSFYGGELINDLEGNMMFIPIESYDGMSDKTTLTGYFVTPDMVFEADYYPKSLNITYGEHIGLAYEHDALCMVKETGDYSDALIVVGMPDTEKSTVQVKFNFNRKRSIGE